MQELQQTDKPTMTMENFELQKEEKMSLDIGEICEHYIVKIG